MNIKLLVEGGDMKPGPAIAQQLGPMGINIGKVISEINNATKEFKGMKVPVEIDIDKKTKEFHIKMFSPPTSELLKKELKLEKGSAKISEQKVSNASMEDIIKIAKIKYSNMLEKDFKSAVKSILGTCASIGILVDNKNPNEIIEEVAEDKYEKEINQQITETSSEKRKRLDEHFAEIKRAQDIKLEMEKKAAEAAEAAKAEAAAKPVAIAEAGKTATSPSAAQAPASKVAVPAKKEENKPEKK